MEQKNVANLFGKLHQLYSGSPYCLYGLFMLHYYSVNTFTFENYIVNTNYKHLDYTKTWSISSHALGLKCSYSQLD